uniref:Uncharacterized protein n=1 Tax=Oryza rufipogon TaxID=4529 RepID=A0A0E0PI83_ORYRU
MKLLVEVGVWSNDWAKEILKIDEVTIGASLSTASYLPQSRLTTGLSKDGLTHWTLGQAIIYMGCTCTTTISAAGAAAAAVVGDPELTAGSRLVSTWVVGQADNFTVVDTHRPIANLASLTEGHVQPDFIGRKVVSAMAWYVGITNKKRIRWVPSSKEAARPNLRTSVASMEAVATLYFTCTRGRASAGESTSPSPSPLP